MPPGVFTSSSCLLLSQVRESTGFGICQPQCASWLCHFLGRHWGKPPPFCSLWFPHLYNGDAHRTCLTSPCAVKRAHRAAKVPRAGRRQNGSGPGGGVGTYLTGVLLLVDDGEGVLRGLPSGLCQGPLHLGALCADELVGLPLGVRHSFLKLRHGLPLHLIHRLLCKGDSAVVTWASRDGSARPPTHDPADRACAQKTMCSPCTRVQA